MNWWDIAGRVSALVILAAVAGATVWLLWSAVRAQHWAWSWRVLAGMVGSVLLLILAVVGLLGQHAIEDARGMRRVICRMNLSHISKGLQMYAGDNDDHAPLADWTDGLAGYVLADSYKCPMTDAAYAFTMNEAFVGALFPDPARARTPVIFDAPGGKNSVGSVDTAQYRHDGGFAHFLLGDGSVEQRGRSAPR